MPTITNSSRSENVSMLLQSMADMAQQDGAPVQMSHQQLEGKKSSLLVEIVVGLGINATWDLIKFAAQRLHQVAWSKADTIEIDGEARSVEEFIS